MKLLKLRGSYYYSVGRPGRLYGRFDGELRHAWPLCDEHIESLKNTLIDVASFDESHIAVEDTNSDICRLCVASNRTTRW